MPSEPLVLPMPIEAYRTMAHRLGWKHEYWDGAARLIPSESAIVVWELDLAGRIDPGRTRAARSEPRPDESPPAAIGTAPREATPDDRDALVELFVAAFDDGPEYCGYPDEAYRRDAVRTADGGGRVRVMDGGPDGTLLGAIVVSERDGLATVEPVMVAPGARRRGVASALLRAAIGAEAALGTVRLRSHSHLANAPSVAWHAARGFVEVPFRSTTAARLTHARWMVGHHERAGDAPAAERARTETARLAEALRALEP